MSYIRKERKDIVYYLREFSRLFMGILFIFSSYVKGVDPYGFSIKLEEYLISFGLDFFSPLAMTMAIGAITVEFLIGVALIVNFKMRFTSWVLLLFMLFFTLLTFWLAYALDIVNLYNSIFHKNVKIFVVTDCGCFGDFITLSNKQTFYKNVVFMLFTLIIFGQNKKYKQNKLALRKQIIALLVGLIAILFVQIYCLRHEPWHDFRPWYKGNFIAAETYSEAPEMDFIFIYKNKTNNAIVEYTTDELMAISEDEATYEDFENNYVYVDRKDKIIKKGTEAKLADFELQDKEQKTDMKESIIEQKGYHFILFIRNIKTASLNNFTQINDFANQCINDNIPFIAVTGSMPEEVAELQQKYNTEFHFYYSDETPLKTAIRNNPGLILLKDGYIIDKWSFRDIPSYDKFKNSIPTYDKNLIKYKIKIPPILPNGVNLDSVNYSVKENMQIDE